MKLLNKLEKKFGKYAIKNLMYYVVAAYFYTYKPLEEVNDDDNEGDLMLGTVNDTKSEKGTV